MKLILLGAPGSGKGTQAEKLSVHFGIPAISTGKIIRDEVARESELGRNVKEYIEAGKLIPDDIIIKVVEARLQKDDCKKGFILDGFPRTIPQAEELERTGVDIDKVLSIEVEDDAIIRRLSGRRECGACGSSYNTEYKPPKEDGVCDVCKAGLVQRDDDKPETIKNRLKVYYAETEPVKEFYRNRGLLVTAIGQERIEDTSSGVLTALGVK